MLYLFTCLSPVCISDQNAIRCYRGYAKDDPLVFASEDLYSKVAMAQSDIELAKYGLKVAPIIEEEDSKDDEVDNGKFLDMREVTLEFNEFLVETDFEESTVTQFYLKESKKLKIAAKQSGKGNIQIEEDDDDDELENAFIDNAMTSKSDMKRVDKILKSIKTEDEGDYDESGGESKELESIIEDNHANYSKISRHYKLFEYVAKSDPG